MALQQRDDPVPQPPGGSHGVPGETVEHKSATLASNFHSAPTLLPGEVTFDNAAATWDILAQHLEAFLLAWEQEPPPELAAHLPAGPLVLRKLALVELIKVDLEQRFARDVGRLIEDYAREFAELADEFGPPADLIYEEYHIRKNQGHAVTPADYIARFPARREELDRLFGMSHEVATASLFTENRAVELKDGDQIDDFDILSRLGSGAFASVYLARQRSMGRLVALKISADRGQEHRTLAQLDHPNIIRIYDQRKLPEQKAKMVYMQFAAGGTLQEVIARIRELPPHDRSGKQLVEVLNEAAEQAGLGPMADPHTLKSWSQLTWPEVVCRLGAQMAHALDYAHRQGVLHRDVKPANILLAADGSPKLADFNISAVATHPSVGAAAYFGGSLAYMSPEHLEAFNPRHARGAEELDARADLYSLAVVLWELLTGNKPFRDVKVDEDWGKTLDAMTRRRRSGELVPPNAGNSEVARNLLEVLTRALLPEPDDRPQSGAELAHELALCAQAQTQRLVRLPQRGWRDWVRRFPVLAVLAVVTVPNALAGMFNYAYNHKAMVDGRDWETEFQIVMTIVNCIAFPLGAYLVYRFVWPVAKLVKSPLAAKALSSEELAAVRVHSLQLGHFAAIIGIALWLVAGIAYPTSIALIGGAIPPSSYPHFIVSLALCGLVAAAYPFLGVTLLAVRVFFPALLRRGENDPLAEEPLRRAAQQSGWYFLIACGVPLIGLAMMILGGTGEQWIHGVVAVVSLVGLAIAFRTHGIIQRDIAALIPVIRPAESFGGESTTTTR